MGCLSIDILSKNAKCNVQGIEFQMKMSTLEQSQILQSIFCTLLSFSLFIQPNYKKKTRDWKIVCEKNNRVQVIDWNSSIQSLKACKILISGVFGCLLKSTLYFVLKNSTQITVYGLQCRTYYLLSLHFTLKLKNAHERKEFVTIVA